jgi:hemolysin III
MTKRPIEQRADQVVLGAGILMSLIGLAWLIRAADAAHSSIAIAAVSVYGATLVTAYSGAILYEARIGGPKAVARFQALDHSTIHLLIAGTYTPICLLALAGRGGWWPLAMVWLIGLTGIAIRVVWLRRPYRWSPAFYLLQGWVGVPWLPDLVRAAGGETVIYIALGGAAYTIGVGFYLWRSFRFGTVVWHLFVVAGSLAHFIAIAFHILPGVARLPGS